MTEINTKTTEGEYRTDTEGNESDSTNSIEVDKINKIISDENDETVNETELALLLEQKKQIEENIKKEQKAEEEQKREIENHIEDVRDNINIFLRWIQGSTEEKNINKKFCEDFSVEYRVALFENICEFFNYETLVTNDVLFYWKLIIMDLLRVSKKYKSYVSDIIFDIETKETNLALKKEKYMFRCFIGSEPLCYFKENGNEYYVS